MSSKDLKAELDKIFSQYIRLKFSDGNGYANCYTCNKKLPIKQMHNGHFVSRTYLATRWDENNCRPQEAGCNLFGGGKTLDFEENLRDEVGDEIVDELKQRRHKIVKLDDAWYEKKISTYKALVNKMGGW